MPASRPRSARRTVRTTCDSPTAPRSSVTSPSPSRCHKPTTANPRRPNPPSASSEHPSSSRLTATQVQLLNGTTVLFTRNRSQYRGVNQPPTVAGTTKLMFTLPTTARPAGAIQVLNDDATLMVLDLRGGKLRIQSLTGGGQATVDLPSDVSIIVAAAWAPDGRTLYFTGEHMFNGQDTLLYGVPIDPTKPLDDPTFFGTPTKLQESLDLHEFESLTVSPDGATLAIEYSHFDDDLQLQLASIVTTSASVPNTPLVPLLTDVTTPGGDYTDYRKPAWSHLAGTSKLAYMRRSFTNCAGCPNTIEILTYNFVTDTTTTVVPPGNDVGVLRRPAGVRTDWVHRLHRRGDTGDGSARRQRPRRDLPL